MMKMMIMIVSSAYVANIHLSVKNGTGHDVNNTIQSGKGTLFAVFAENPIVVFSKSS